MALPRPTSQQNLFPGVTGLVDALERGQLAQAMNADTLDGIDSLGFLQLATAASRKVAFGSATITWAGGVPAGGTAVITHGLGATPVTVVALSTVTTGGFAVATYLTGAPGATTFTVNGYAQGGNPAAATTCTVYWLAIA
jgi:hypothetical protein